jgi:hypothetical protein
MPSPQIAQGTLNRLIASVTWNNFPGLNVTPSFLGREAIRLAFEGAATDFIPTLTGTVTSPGPMQTISLTINLLKTQGLAALYESQRQTNSVLGNGTVRPDATTLPPYDILNCGIQNVRELNFSGEDAGYAVSIGGYLLINSSLWG